MFPFLHNLSVDAKVCFHMDLSQQESRIEEYPPEELRILILVSPQLMLAF